MSARARRRARIASVAVLSFVLASGCATPLPMASVRVEGVPYFPQDDLQCGPAALASLLHRAGAARDVDTLRAWMFTPGLGGTLQQDVLGAARRAGTVPVRIDGTLAAIRDQLAVGRPVLVLLDLALPSLPHWHYAVVTGIDAQRGRVLVGGPEGESDSFAVRDFERAWGYAERWGIVTLRIDEPPTALAQADVVAGVSAFESAAPPAAARQAYDAALAAWPDAPVLHFGAGNVALALQDLDAAAVHFEAVLRIRGSDAAASNNLAEVRRRQGRHAEAVEHARRAVRDAATPELQRAAQDTLRETLAACPTCEAARLDVPGSSPRS